MFLVNESPLWTSHPCEWVTGWKALDWERIPRVRTCSLWMSHPCEWVTGFLAADAWWWLWKRHRATKESHSMKNMFWLGEHVLYRTWEISLGGIRRVLQSWLGNKWNMTSYTLSSCQIMISELVKLSNNYIRTCQVVKSWYRAAKTHRMP